MNKRINPSKRDKKDTKIKPKVIAEDDMLRFSFKHYTSTNKFSPDKQSPDYFEKLFSRLKNLSTLKSSEFFSNRSQSLRSHKINWEDTTEKDGFTHLNSQLKEIPAYQFQISANEHGRVHGFVLSNIFFIIWLDPDHNLYS